MAERRMFAKTIIDSDAFLDMPLSTQALYFHLSMRADDDGFINNPRKIQRMVGCADDDLRVLIAKNFIIPFESGIVVIKHWRIHNYLRSDRYKETVYKDEKAQLVIKDNGAYTQAIAGIPSGIPTGIPSAYQCETQVRIGKDSIGKDSIEDEMPKRTRFVPPTVEDVSAYCSEKHLVVDPQRFVDFYTSKGWKVGSSPMKDWKAAARNWAARDRSPQQPIRQVTAQQYTQREYTEADLESRTADLIAEAAGL